MAASILFVGHATVLVELDGVRLLTDPLLRTRVAHLRRLVPVAGGELNPLDAVLLSHLHWDHLDLPSLRRLGLETRLIAPRGAGGLLRRRGFANVVEVTPGDIVSVGGLSVRATEAEHEGGRLPFGARGPALGYVVEGTRTVYFAGDTDLFAGMADLAPLDVALLPVGGWGPRLPPGHLDPADAAEALRLLRPRLAIPIHWGTYALPGRGSLARAGLAPSEFAARAAEAAPEVEIRVLRPGERTEI